MALLTVSQNTFQNVASYEEAVEDVEALKENIRECYSEITKSSEEIQLSVSEHYLSKSNLETIQRDFQTSISQSASEIRMDFTAITNQISEGVAANQQLLEEYIRFRGALIELGKVGNAFTAELSNDRLSFKENGQEIIDFINLPEDRQDELLQYCEWQPLKEVQLVRKHKRKSDPEGR